MLLYKLLKSITDLDYVCKSFFNYLKKKRNITYWNNLLISASKNGHLEVVKYLVSIGADITYYSIKLAGRNGHFEVVEYLANIKTTEIDCKIFNRYNNE